MHKVIDNSRRLLSIVSPQPAGPSTPAPKPKQNPMVVTPTPQPKVIKLAPVPSPVTVSATPVRDHTIAFHHIKGVHQT